MGRNVITVRGPIPAEEMGLTLPHEHIMVDFVGADKTGPDRYDPEEVKHIMLPYLREIREFGVKSFVECTPMYLARDPNVLRDLALASGLNILTNTGQYKEPFLPATTFDVSADQLADSWLNEVENGIDDTGVKPGFIKTAVEPTPLAPTQQKVIRAAAIVSRKTGLTIATHTGIAQSALEIISILESAGVDPAKWIFVHAQNEANMEDLVKVAHTGAWISLDGLGPDSAERHIRSLKVLLDSGFQDKILLSHDAGWYHVGEERGGIVRPFTYLFKEFLQAAEEQGIDKDTLHTLTAVNPGQAYAVG
jgi:predicted metal-dependent phosphotriesterase family hydrolase